MSLFLKGILIGLIFGVPVCFFLVWHCGRQCRKKWLAGGFRSIYRNLFLVGRADRCGCFCRKKEKDRKFPEDEPDFRGSFKLVWNPCFYTGNFHMNSLSINRKVKRGVDENEKNMDSAVGYGYLIFSDCVRRGECSDEYECTGW